MFFKTAAAVGLIKATATSLGCDLPDGFTATVDRANSLIAAAESIGDGGGQRLHGAVLDALEHGRDLHTDKPVAATLLDLQLSTAVVGQAARQRADHDIAAAVVEYADAFLAAWSAALQPHLDALIEAAQANLPDNLHDTATISSRGAVAMRHWANAQEAIRLTTAAADGAMSLCTAARITLTRDRKPLLTTPADPAAFDQIIRDTSAHVTVWSAARAGLPLRLVGSLGELLERLADYDQQRQAAIAAAEELEAHPRRAHA